MGTSALLAALTLGVFGLNQVRGPESVTVLFVQAVAVGDLRTAQRLVVGDEGVAADIATVVSAFARSGATFTITDVDRRGNTALVSVLWLRGEAHRTMMLPLVKTGQGWKIDARPQPWGGR